MFSVDGARSVNPYYSGLPSDRFDGMRFLNRVAPKPIAAFATFCAKS
jgi:hypothetical protein